MKTFTWVICTVWISCCCPGLLQGEQAGDLVNIPGGLDRFQAFFKPGELNADNLVGYITDILLLEQLPQYDDMRIEILLKAGGNRIKRERYLKQARKNHQFLLNRTSSFKLKKIFSAHEEIKSYLGSEHLDANKNHPLSLDLENKQQFTLAEKLLAKAGLILQRGENPTFRLIEHYELPLFEVNWYYRIGWGTLENLEKQINTTGRLDFFLDETKVRLPRDLQFFIQVTGLNLTPDSFIKTLTTDKRLQLLVGILYRLSDEELHYIDTLAGAMHYEVWKKIYATPDFLGGMFILSHGLRVINGKLDLPGGEKAQLFWETLAGTGKRYDSVEFLQALATKDNSKLDYFYLFSYFLREPVRRVFLCQYDPVRFMDIYSVVKLGKNEIPHRLKLPQLRNGSIFILPYILEIDEPTGQVIFPGGIDAWVYALGVPGSNPGCADILVHLVNEKDKSKSLERFIGIYRKFFHRPGLLTRESLKELYDHYFDYLVMLDFLEKIPVKKPGTVIKLFNWIKAFEAASMPAKEKPALRGVVQALLAWVATRAGQLPGEYDWDQVIQHWLRIPPSGALAYDRVFQFMQDGIGFDYTQPGTDRCFRQSLFPTLTNGQAVITIDQQPYVLGIEKILDEEVKEIMESQEVATLENLVAINKELLVWEKQGRLGTKRIKALKKRFQNLRFAKIEIEIKKTETKSYIHPGLETYLKPYKTDWLADQLARLEDIDKRKRNGEAITSVIRELKAGCLLHELKHYLVTAVYAAALKHSGPRLLLNPDLTALHDFSSRGRQTAWNSCEISPGFAEVEAYHFQGGLSRLNIVLAVPLAEYLFPRDDKEYYVLEGGGILYNHLNLFFPHRLPYPDVGQEYAGLLIDYGRELVEKTEESRELMGKVKSVLARLTSGYRYSRLVANLKNGTAGSTPVANQFYFHELLQLGEAFFDQEEDNALCKPSTKLQRFSQPLLKRHARRGLDRLGGIYCNTFATLLPNQLKLFPPALTGLFANRWTSAEMNNELKLRTAYFLYHQQKPSQLLGILVYRFLFQETAGFRQFFQGDRLQSDALFTGFSETLLNRLYHDLRRSGVLRIKE